MSEKSFPEEELKVKGSFRIGRLLASLFLVVFVITYWFVFYSPEFANKIFIIGLRRAYVQSVWKVRGYFQQPERYFPPFKPPYPITVIGKLQNDMGYIYTFVGKLDSLDLSHGILNLRDFDGKLHSFLLPISSVNQDDIMYRIDIVLNEPGEPSKTKTLLVNINTYQNNEIFTKDSVYSVVWHDPRSLKEIQNAKASTVNEYKTNILNVIRYGQIKNESN